MLPVSQILESPNLPGLTVGEKELNGLRCIKSHWESNTRGNKDLSTLILMLFQYKEFSVISVGRNPKDGGDFTFKDKFNITFVATELGYKHLTDLYRLLRYEVFRQRLVPDWNAPVRISKYFPIVFLQHSYNITMGNPPEMVPTFDLHTLTMDENGFAHFLVIFNRVAAEYFAQL